MREAVIEAQPAEEATEVRLPVDVEVRTLKPHPDDRGYLVELFRPDWDIPVRPIQWNLTVAYEGVLRGPQFHLHRHEYLILLEGRMSVGLADIRRGSPTEGLSVLVEAAASPEGLPLVTIAAGGVFHGFYFHEDSKVLHAVPTIWDKRDEFRVRWNDPELGIPWPTRAPVQSELERAAPHLMELAEFFPIWRGPRPPKTPSPR
jgi:dTDP-4-dehydrorhamnose 3,5-epimerase